MSPAKQRKNYLALDYMNGFASLLVVLIHVLSIGINGATRGTWQSALVYFPWQLSAFVVPMFLYTGAVKFAGQWGERTLSARAYIKYIYRRIIKIYLPYVLWVVIYYLAFMRISYVRGEWREFLEYLHTGTLSSPFYYVITVMQFYFLAPLWKWLIVKIPAYIGIGASLLVTVLGKQLPTILPYFKIDFPYTDRIVPSYLVFWVIGLYVGMHYDDIKGSLAKKSGMIFSAVCVLAYTTVLWLQFSNKVYLLQTEDLKIVVDVLSIFLLHGIMLYLEHAPRAVRCILAFLYESSFFVYLSHCLFLTLLMDILYRRGIGGLSTQLLLRFVVCYTLPYLAYTAWKYTKCCAKCTVELLRAKK